MCAGFISNKRIGRARLLHVLPVAIGIRVLVSMIGLVSPGCAPAHAQDSSAFVYVTDVRVTQLSNAVRLAIDADGTINLDDNSDFFFQFIDVTPQFHLVPVRQMHLRLLNCRSRLGSFKDVGLYPVDHIEFAVPQDSQNGVGLDVTISFDEPVMPGKITDWFDGGNPDLPSVSVVESPDHRSIIVTVTSDLFPERKPVRKSPEKAGEQSLHISALPGGLVEVEAENEPLSRVLDEVSDISGVSVSVEPSSERVVSAVLLQRPADIISTLSNAYGLSLAVQNGTFILSPPESGAGESANLTIFRLRYLNAQQAVSLLPTFLLHFTHPDLTRNAVVVSGSPALRAKVSDDLSRLDTPSPQCRVAVTFVTYTQTRDFERTLELARRTSNSSLALSVGGGGGPSGTVVYSRGANQPGIDAAITALDQDSDLHIESKPTLLLSNGQKGSIFDGQTYFVPDPTAYRGRLQQLQVGTSLEVTPLMGRKGTLTLRVTTSSSDAVSRDPVSGLPVIETRQVDDTVRLKSGDTLYIGGLEETQRITTHFRIPILGDIPVLGSLFRGRRSHREHVQIAVFITGTQVF